MNTQQSLENFTFESRETYEQAKMEMEIIQQLQQKADLTDARTALKVYNKAVAEKMFSSIVGYCFLTDLRHVIIKNDLATEQTLPDIPVKEIVRKQRDTMPTRPAHGDRYQRLYEGQKLLNKKMKIALVAMVIMLIGFIIINFRFEYSIFTYFTNYKANMEEELINKYEYWQEDLEKRESQLEQKEGSGS